MDWIKIHLFFSSLFIKRNFFNTQNPRRTTTYVYWTILTDNFNDSCSMSCSMYSMQHFMAKKESSAISVIIDGQLMNEIDIPSSWYKIKCLWLLVLLWRKLVLLCGLFCCPSCYHLSSLAWSPTTRINALPLCLVT